MSYIKKPAISVLCAKNTPGKIVLVSCMGNCTGLDCAPRIKRCSELNFTGIFTKSLSNIISKIRDGEPLKANLIAADTKSKNIKESYEKYALQNGLSSKYGTVILMADMISMSYDNKTRGNTSSSGLCASGVVLNQCLNGNYFNNCLEMIKKKYDIFAHFRDSYLFENAMNPRSFKKKDSSIYEQAVIADEEKMSSLSESASRIINGQVNATGGSKGADNDSDVNVASMDYYSKMVN